MSDTKSCPFQVKEFLYNSFVVNDKMECLAMCTKKDAALQICEALNTRAAETGTEGVIAKKCSAGPPYNYLTADGSCTNNKYCAHQRPLDYAPFQVAPLANPAPAEDEVIKIVMKYLNKGKIVLYKEMGDELVQWLKSRREGK